MLSRSARLILITFLFSQQVAAQDSRPGFRLIRDKGEVVGVDYFGAAGLEQAKLHEYPKLVSAHFVYGTEITSQDIRYLAKLKNLVELKMGFAGVDSEYVTVDGKLNELSKLKNLKAVHLCKQFMRDEDLRFIGDLPELECLEFNANTNGHGKPGPTATDDCVKHLVKAKSLRDLCILGEGSFSDQFVKDLTSGLPGLEHLEIASDQLTDETLRRLGTRCKNLKWLNVSSKRFTDEGIDLLSQSNRLERLWVYSPELTEKCFRSVAGLKRLRHLELTTKKIDDQGVQAIAELPKLEIVALRQPVLTDQQFAAFSSHPSLESAFINGQDLTPEHVLKVIKTIPTLKHLSIRSNPDLQAAVNRELGSRVKKK